MWSFVSGSTPPAAARGLRTSVTPETRWSEYEPGNRVRCFPLFRFLRGNELGSPCPAPAPCRTGHRQSAGTPNWCTQSPAHRRAGSSYWIKGPSARSTACPLRRRPQFAGLRARGTGRSGRQESRGRRGVDHGRSGQRRGRARVSCGQGQVGSALDGSNLVRRLGRVGGEHEPLANAQIGRKGSARSGDRG